MLISVTVHGVLVILAAHAPKTVSDQMIHHGLYLLMSHGSQKVTGELRCIIVFKHISQTQFRAVCQVGSYYEHAAYK